jgi:hypothetical protein
VIGDPSHPDFTAERVVVSIRPRFGVPDIGGVRLVRPRLYGSYLDGKLSFGALDPLIFTGSEEPFRLPDIVVEIDDGRGLFESGFGPIGIKLEGSGNLRGGFGGHLAAVAPGFSAGGCKVDRLSAYGSIAVASERPKFDGPVRLSGFECPAAAVRMTNVALAANLTADPAMNGAEGTFSLRSGAMAAGEYRLGQAGGTSRFVWRKGRLTARYDLQGKSIETPQLRAPQIKLAGRLCALDGFARFDLESDLSGTIASPGAPLVRAMEAVADNAQGSLIAQLARQISTGLQRETRGATFAADLTMRRTPDGDSLVIPSAILRGRSGQALASLSRLQVRAGEGGPQILSGNFATGGPGLPRISGRARQARGGGYAFELAMADYSAGDARLGVPQLVVVQRPGSLGFAGQMRLSGALPGGRADNLVMPVEGSWSQVAGLSAWRRCTQVSFDRLRFASLDLSKRALTVCPPRGGAIVRTGKAGLKIAAGVPALDLAGRLGTTPIRIASGPVGFAWPGNLAARTLDVTLGPRDSASTFRISQLSARLGRDIAGSFEGADVRLGAVPLDLSGMSGRWQYAGGRLALSQGSLRVEDREQVDRFEPLIARYAVLTLADNVITAQALLREPQSDREVVRADIRHDLASGQGHADLTVEALVFDKAVQPDRLTHLALGVIANANGTVRGTGRIDWDEAGVTSTGRFATDALDFAAAFGPVTGASGTIEFTDLLGLVTAPSQTLKVASVNPGIEVNDGVVTFTLLPGNVLSLDSARWPFFDGTLTLRPVTIAFGSDAPVRYVLEIDGIDAALFVQRLELGNLAATGTFDGQMPLVFDQDGGRIEGGQLQSRPPGGNVAYVGELSYKDLTPMANYAFDALRSVNYRQMRIEMDGALDGEIVTRVTFDGVSQGEGTTSNFITKRIAKLPIRFRVNVRAPFMQLIASTRSLYDPEFIRDPRELGIVGGSGAPVLPGAPATPATREPLIVPTRPGKPGVQPSESDPLP